MVGVLVMKKYVITIITLVFVIISVTVPSFATTYKLQFFLDYSFQQEYSNGSVSVANSLGAAHGIVQYAIIAYENRFNIELAGFTYADIGQQNSDGGWLYWGFPRNFLPLESCPISYDSECLTSSCGSNCENEITATENHHKNGFRNWSPFINYSYINDNADVCILFTATKLCYKNNGSHSASLGGLGNPGFVLVRSLPTDSYSVRVLQHELGHSFGLSDNQCSGMCIMANNYYGDTTWTRTDIWCNSCEEKLEEFFN